jgi:hypothetical protein
MSRSFVLSQLRRILHIGQNRVETHPRTDPKRSGSEGTNTITALLRLLVGGSFLG